MGATGSIPDTKTKEGSGVGENLDSNTSANPALSDVGAFCKLAIGVSAPIASAIDNVVKSLTSLQGAVDNILYLPARGLAELQRKILSGEILNDFTLKIVYSLSKLILNAVKNLGQQIAIQQLSQLASKIGNKLTNTISNLNTGIEKVQNRIVGLAKYAEEKLVKGEVALATGVYKLASLPGYAIQVAGRELGYGSTLGNALMDLGFNLNVGLATSIATGFGDLISVTKGVLAPLTTLQLPKVVISKAAEQQPTDPNLTTNKTKPAQ